MNIFQSLFGVIASADLINILNKKSFLLAARTRPGFAEGCVHRAVNIPLDTVPCSMVKLKGKENIIEFCKERTGQNNFATKWILQCG